MKQKIYAFLLLAITSLSARAELIIDITGGTESAQPIAIVPFKTADGINFDISKIIENDLYRSGLFKPLGRELMPQKPSDMTEVNFPSWRGVGTDNVVIGSLRQNEKGEVIARFWLLDAVSQKPLLGYDMPAVPGVRMRQLAHQIADLIYEKLTGTPGFFNTRIAYIGAAGYGYQRRYELVVADADGESPRTIATSREPLMSPAWSPNGKQLAYVGYERGRSAVYIQSVDTGQVRKLLSEKGINGSPSWSPDGKQIAMTLSFENNPDIYIVDSETGGSRRRLTNHYGIDTEASWSPDGQHLLFTSDRGGSPQVYKISINGGEPERLTFEGRQNLRASYSPDGKNIVMVRAEGGRYRVAMMNAETKDTRNLTDGSLDESPQFAPNGAVVIYATQTGKGAELATISIDGRVRSRLRQAGDVREPAWSPLNR